MDCWIFENLSSQPRAVNGRFTGKKFYVASEIVTIDLVRVFE